MLSCRQQLERHYGVREGMVLYRIVMEECFALSQADILLGKDSEISRSDKCRLREITGQLLKNVPLQYILGYADFCGHRFVVRPGCLIPRPETEDLVSEIAGLDGRGSLLEIGTGSGCIAISLALEGFDVTATDVSAEALEIAGQNAVRLGAKVEFVHENILHPVPSDRVWDVIVSNPPYVMCSEKDGMDANVLEYEPHLALFVPDDDPLLFYRHISGYALRHLSQGGRLFFEINHLLAEETAGLVASAGFRDVCLKSDRYEKKRFLCACV